MNHFTSVSARSEFYCKCLCTSKMFRQLSKPSLEYLSGVTKIRVLKPGERLVARGDEMVSLGVVLKGGVRSTLTSQDGGELSISVLQHGAFWGVLGVAEPTPSPWDCFAFGETEMAMILTKDFRAAMARFPDLGIVVAKMLNYRLKKAYAFVSNVALESVENRIRWSLLMLAGDHNHSDSTEPLEISITQESLSRFVQCTRPTVNKALKNLELLGLVKIGYGVIRITNLKGLQAGFDEESLLVF